jgi:hypothetical protein
MKWTLVFVTLLLNLYLPAKAAGPGGHGGHGHSSHSGGRSLGSRSYSHSSSRYGGSHGYRSSSSHSGRGSVSSYTPHSSSAPRHSLNYCASCSRSSNGRIARSSESRREFMHQSGYPNGRPGYVIDHVVPLKRGGRDVPSNMQWQTAAEAKAKDKVE